MSIVVAFLFLELLAIATINISFCDGSSDQLGCIESERQALLRFKQDLIDPSNRLAFWRDGDCCTWAGVVCDSLTGHVHELNLRNPYDDYSSYAFTQSMLVGKLNPSLLNLKHLNYLDLSGNYFEATQFPKFVGSMRNLKYLNLSLCGFVGMIPHQLGNLSHLQYLDLRPYNRSSLYVENSVWLSNLSLLKHLDLSWVDLSKACDLLPMVNTLLSLEVLQLSYCQLHHFPPLHIVNFSSLTTLDLSNNLFDNSLIPSWVFSLSYLVHLDLHYNNIQGPIPDELQNLTSLRYLVLSYNRLNSSIPNWLYKFSHLEYLCLYNNNLQGMISEDIGNMTSINWLDLSLNKLEGKIPRSLGGLCKLRSILLSHIKLSQDISEVFDIFSGCVSDRIEHVYLLSSHLSGCLPNQLGQFKNIANLYLSDNMISGPIPVSLGELSSLRTLDLSFNKLNGTLSEIHFANLTRLSFFYVCGNSLMLNVSLNWVPPFQLQELGLRSCHVGFQIPLWFYSQKSLIYLDISNSGIISTIPNRFWKLFPSLVSFNLSHNQIYGEVPNLTEAIHLELFDLSSNNLSGPLPLISIYMNALDLSDNAFSGSIFHFVCYRMNETKGMKILNLRNNLLFGELPDCWMNWKYLLVLNLGRNSFHGNLPNSMGTLSSLQSLHLRRNSLSGEIPASLKNCTELIALDIGENKFFGNVLMGIGERFTKMMILNLRSNKFHGFLPTELCLLTSIQILDLADNNFFGSIPRCINNFTAMVTMSYSGGNCIQYLSSSPYPGSYRGFAINYHEDALLVMKGKAVQYDTTLNLVRIIDLSQNNFSGEIPMEVTNLVALQSLNLSYNYLSGRILENIGAMKSVESIDFSKNQLSGEIPSSISKLTSLSHLNLSNNNLFGNIPSSTQILGFDASCFTGNELCGAPLPNNYVVIVPTPDDQNSGDNDGNEDEVDWFYVSMAPGFAVGFWCVIGPLVVNRRWRYMYCQFLNRLQEKLGNLVRMCY
ncbi:receptor-like protein EIX2 [Pistacia vera]|uniref:receptor-like protein EIX2 n=1 Tax=Pistacia vera TaxID=55513 RepID=UPI00126326A2|nr:receptor-like protein EIX2 [Pistacia vera]